MNTKYYISFQDNDNLDNYFKLRCTGNGGDFVLTILPEFWDNLDLIPVTYIKQTKLYQGLLEDEGICVYALNMEDIPLHCQEEGYFPLGYGSACGPIGLVEDYHSAIAFWAVDYFTQQLV